MAKRYTRRQWEDLQASFPIEDRTPYELSPDLPGTVAPNLLPEVSALAEEREVAEAETAKVEEEAGAEISFLENVISNARRLATGEIEAINQSTVTERRDDAGDEETFTASDGKVFTDRNAFNLYQQELDRVAREEALATRGRKSAFDILREEFNRYGLGFLIEDSEKLARQGISPEEFEIGLRNTKAYQERFAANAKRQAAGLASLTPAEYLALEDAYQRTMRQYGLPKSFYEKTGIGNQPELDNLIAADVSPSELEDRVQLAVERVNNASPEVLRSLEEFYPGISKANIVAYVLDPQRALPLIQRQVRAAELGGEALRAGLRTGVQRAEELERIGITQGQAREGFQAIAGGLERGSQLASIYGESPYTQETAEQEVFGLAGAPEAGRRRKRLTQQEQAAFGGQTGITGGALARDRAGAI